MRRAFCTIALVLALSWLASHGGADAFSIVEIQPDAEKRLGQEIDKWMHGHRKFSYRPDYHVRARRIGARLAGVADSEGRYEWRFQVLNDTSANMMASCAGYVYICRGILEAKYSDDEVAGMMAHELVHIMKQHVAKSYALQYRVREVDDAVVDRAVEDLRMYKNGAKPGPYQIFTYTERKMMRDFEREADVVGVQYARAAGDDPLAHARLLDTLLKSDKRKRSIKETLLLTHPPSTERIKRIEKEARRLDG